METHKFKLLAGVECEIKKLTGKHQRLFTQEEFKKDGKGANIAIADIIVRLGSKTDVTEEDVNRMLTFDRKMILLEARGFSLKRHKLFKFDFKYTNEDNKLVSEPMEMDVNIKDFESKPYKRQFEEYNDIWELLKDGKYSSVVLEDCGKEIFFSLLDGAAENRVQNMSKKKRSSHTLLNMYKPRYYEVLDEGNGASKNKKQALINLNLDDLSMDDIEDLRLAIKQEEGFQDTLAIFENPETNQDEEIDVLTIPAFFFPSNAL